MTARCFSLLPLSFRHSPKKLLARILTDNPRRHKNVTYAFGLPYGVVVPRVHDVETSSDEGKQSLALSFRLGCGTS